MFDLERARLLIDGEYKVIKFVRTVAGMRRYRQDKGSIIIKDGDNPLDAIFALPNDVPGYEKVGDQQGNSYYIGREGNSWAVRNPDSNEVMSVQATEEDAFIWLNERLGGRAGALQEENNPFENSPNIKPNDSQLRRELRRSLSGAAYGLSPGQANAIDNMDDSGVQEYQRARDRGLSHEQSLEEGRRVTARTRAASRSKR